MPSASIQSLVNGIDPVVGASRDDIVAGDVVIVSSVNVHTTYAWTLAYKPAGSSATFSGSSTAASPGNFTIDLEGPYLVRLTADLGLGTESIQYVRIRFPTVLGALALVAAGEGYGGAIPVPVDQTPTGWTDALNQNLLTLLGLVGRSAFSGRVFTVDPEPGYADFQLVQAAIDAAVAAGASSVSPFVVLVRPGLYVEDVTFQANVYVLGWPGTPAFVVGFPLVIIRGVHVVSTPGGADVIILGCLTLVNIVSSTDATVQKTGSGSVTFHECVLEQSGLNVAQGPALQVDAGITYLVESHCEAASALPDDRAAITQTNSSTLDLEQCSVVGPTGLQLNTSFASSVFTTLTNTSVIGSGATGYAISSDATDLVLDRADVHSSNSIVVAVHPGAGAMVSGQSVVIRNSQIGGVLQFDVTGIVGSTDLFLGASDYADIVFPGGAPTTQEALTKGTSLFYDNTTTGLAATNVQDAIDETHAEAVLVRTLDDAYNGGVPLSGGGRTIYGSAGSVQILDAVFPSDPPPAGNTNAVLEVVSSVRVGAVDFPEIDVDPNPYGSGPSILMGSRVVPGNIPFGTGTATVMAQSTGTPLFRNYNLRLQTESSIGGGAIGRLIIQGGDGLDNGAFTPVGSSVYIQAGSAHNVLGLPGNVHLVPGGLVGGTSGHIVLGDLDGATPATLTAANPCADPIGVTGSITFATNMGAVTLTVAAADTRAAVVAALDAIEGISASEGGGIITITSDALGPNAEVYFLSATAGVDAAIGGFDGQVMVDGTYGRTIEVQVTDTQEVSFGINGVTGPMIYNADTGKLTVPGLIDPTAVVFEEAAAPATGATEGAIFVSDGSGGLVVGDLYYRGASSAVPVNLSAVGATPPLADILAAGNTTGGTNIVLTSGDAIEGEGGVGLAGDVVLHGGTATGGGATDGGFVHLWPGAGFGGGADGFVRLTDSADALGVRLSITAADTLSIDALAGGGMPLVYDASTGKLTVPGLIDPTGLVLTFAAAPATGAAEGALFVSDGSGGLTSGTLYFRQAGGGSSVPVSGGAFAFPLSAAPAQTAEGSAVWDTDDDLLTVGTGASRKTMADTDSVQTLSGKTLTTPTIASFTNAGHTHQDAAGGAKIDHGLALNGLSDDDHAQYVLLAGNAARNVFSGTLDVGTGALLLPLAVAPAQTAEGSVVWDSNDDLLTIGTGASRKVLVDTDSTQTLSNKTLALTTIAVDDGITNDVTDVVLLEHTTSGLAAPSIGTGLRFRAENASGAGVDVGRVAAYLENATAGAETGSVAFYTRTGGGALAQRWAVEGDGLLVPFADNAVDVGESAHRVRVVASTSFRVHNLAGDTHPVYMFDQSGYAGGPGGGSPVDITLARTTGPLWAMSVGLRVGGDVARHEGAITFGTTRTAAGGGDDVSVLPSAAIAAAGTAEPGGALDLFASAAAATGPGNFSASGGAVRIKAGEGAAVNVAQADGVDVTISGGDAASGSGGGAATGGGVALQGAGGVADGNGGDILVQPGALDGSGQDGLVVFSINGASRTPNLVPRATNEGSLGLTTTRWSAIAFQNENSSGQKVVGRVSKVFGDSPYPVASTDYIILYDPTAGSSTINLPAAASNTDRILVIKHSSASANTVTIDGDGGELIDGAATLVLSAWQSVTLICDGTAWYVL